MMEWTGLEQWMEWNVEHTCRGVLNTCAHGMLYHLQYIGVWSCFIYFLLFECNELDRK